MIPEWTGKLRKIMENQISSTLTADVEGRIDCFIRLKWFVLICWLKLAKYGQLDVYYTVLNSENYFVATTLVLNMAYQYINESLSVDNLVKCLTDSILEGTIIKRYPKVNDNRI